MIDKIYIDRAVSLRKEYLNLNGNLKNYEDFIIKLKVRIEDTIIELQSLIDTSSEISIEDIQKKSVENLMGLEEETQRIQKFVEPINKKMESLQKEEQELYNQIKLKHPDLDNKDIIGYIQQELKKSNLS